MSISGASSERTAAIYSLIETCELGGINVSHTTSQRDVGLLEQVFLIAMGPPWFTNALKHIAQMPKLQFLDTGLLATTRTHP